MFHTVLLLQELTVSDIALLLRVYKQAAHLKQKEIVEMVQSTAFGDTFSEPFGRFSHCSSGSLTLADVKQVLQDLQQRSSLSYRDTGHA